MKDLTTLLVGSMTAPIFAAAMLFALLGWILFKLLTGNKRDPKSERTPPEWDWDFWVKDNWKEAMLTGISMYILVRFSPEVISYFMPELKATFTEKYDGMFIYLVLGLLLSKILNKVKKFITARNKDEDK